MRTITSLLALPVAVALLTGTARADTPTTPGVDVATARFSWTVPSRYRDSWKAWSERRSKYDEAYVHPRRWPIDIDACDSNGGGRRITDYAIRVDGPVTLASHGRDCDRRLYLRRLGTYRVTVAVHTSDGWSSPYTESVTPRDHLIVSLGDSMASGESVPDRRGHYVPGAKVSLSGLLDLPSGASPAELGLHALRRVNWRDDRCHRSALGGHARAAEALERRDRHSSVTFVSLACSGAEAGKGMLERYGGIMPPEGAPKLDPQVEVLADLIGGKRDVDAILMSIGVNDLGFSGIVKRCAKRFEPLGGDGGCAYDNGTVGKLARLEGRLDEIGDALRGFEDAEIYVTDYPAAPFGRDRGGCGVLGIWPTGISGAEAGAMYQIGARLNWSLQSASSRNGWNFVPGMTERFLDHHYCARASYFTSLESSVRQQGGIHGAVHPNLHGHGQLADLLLDAIVLGRPRAPHWRATITVEQAKVMPGPPAPPPPNSGRPGKRRGRHAARTNRLSLKLFDPAAPGGTVTQDVAVPRTGAWFDLPAGALSYTLDLYAAPRPPRYATEIRLVTIAGRRTIGAVHGLADGFGAGVHEARHPQGDAVRYRIDVQRVGGMLGIPESIPLGSGNGAGAARPSLVRSRNPEKGAPK